MEEEGFADAEEGEAAQGSYVAELNKLTALPRAEDTLLYCVPVCAPYAAVAKYKYRVRCAYPWSLSCRATLSTRLLWPQVKLTPGTGKKGRAGKQALDVLTRLKECVGRERDLIKMLSDPEVVNAMVGDVKVSSAGVHAAFNAKRSAKQAKKSKPKPEDP